MGKDYMKLEKYDRLIAYWLANPFQSYKAIATACGISEDTFIRWRKDEDFKQLYHEACKEHFAALEVKAISNLDTMLTNQEWNATKFVLEGTGYKPDDNINLKGETAITISVTED